MPTTHSVQVSEDTDDPVWDAFVARIAGGCHLQTALWGQVKATQGWKALRVLVTCDGRLVGGVQVLMRPISLIGTVAYVTKGPLCAMRDPALVALILDELNRVCRMHRARYLIVQPANDCDWIAGHLTQRGFRATSVEVAPTATILLDLSNSLDELLGQMHGPRRRGIQRGIRERLTVREGTEADHETFYKLHLVTSRRHRFDPFPSAYFARMWEILRPRGHIAMILSEHHGEAVAGLLVVAFGDTATFKAFGWSGVHSNLRPSEAAFWGAICWAKERGFRYFDFEGVDPETARTILEKRRIPKPLQASPTFFKFAYGGRVTLCPVAYDHVFNPLLRWGFRLISPVFRQGSALYYGSRLYWIAERLRKSAKPRSALAARGWRNAERREHARRP